MQKNRNVWGLSKKTLGNGPRKKSSFRSNSIGNDLGGASPVRIVPTGFSRVQTYTTTYPIYSSYPTVIHRSIPFVAHKRIVTATRISSTPTRIIRSPSRVISSPLRIINVRARPVTNRRFEHKVRSHPHYYATENYLNSSSVKDFDDETRELRAATNSLLKKVHTNVQRAHSVSPISYSSKYEQRYGTDAYLAQALGANSISDEINREINAKYNIHDSNRKYVGKTHLASVRIVGDKGYAKRAQILPTTPMFFRKDKVRKDINFLSYYKKNLAAADAHQPPTFSLPSAKLDPNRASRKFSQPKPLEDPNLDIKEKQAARLDRLNAFGDDDEITLEKRKAQRLEAAKQLEQKALEEEIIKKAEQAKRDEEARRAELDRQEKLAAQAAAERAAEFERKEEEARAAAEVERKEEEARAAAELERQEEEARAAAELERKEAEAREAAELERQEEEARVAAELERKEEEARAAAEALAAEEARVAEEQAREEQRVQELNRLAELEKLAELEHEAELARQAAELAEIARQQDELARQTAESDAQEDDTAVGNEPEEENIADETVEPSVEPEVEQDVQDDQIVSEPVVDEPESPVLDSQDVFKSGSEAEEPEEAEEDDE